ncbi:13300_t:CDS:2, partial [Racocetra fulgida]
MAESTTNEEKNIDTDETVITHCIFDMDAEILARFGKTYSLELRSRSLGLRQHEVATSSSRESFNIKASNNRELFDMFDSITCGDDANVKNGKPAPDLFLAACEKMGNPPTNQCLVFEDSINGVKAAKNANMKVIWVPDPMIAEFFPSKNGADEMIFSLSDFEPAKFGLPPFVDEPPALRAADQEVFAHITATHRWKDIINKAIDNIRDSLHFSEIDKNEEGKKIIASMEELINQIQRKDQLMPDITSWNDALNTYFKDENWFTATWLFAECYLYRRIVSIITNTKHWRNHDPYFRQKEDAFRVSFSSIIEFSKRIDELISSQKLKINDRIIFYELAQISLWGNATDLSMLPNFGINDNQLQNIESKQLEESKKFILVNDLEKT